MKNIESEIFNNKIKMSLQGIGTAAFAAISGISIATTYKTFEYLMERNQAITPDEWGVVSTLLIANSAALAITSAFFIHAKDSYKKIKDLRRYQNIKRYF